MDYLYRCSKCGTIYDTTDDAWNCEDKHNMPDYWTRYDDQLRKFITWKAKDILPRTMAFASYPIRNAPTQTTDEPEPVFGLYEFKRYLTPEEIRKMKDEYREQHPVNSDEGTVSEVQ